MKRRSVHNRYRGRSKRKVSLFYILSVLALISLGVIFLLLRFTGVSFKKMPQVSFAAALNTAWVQAPSTTTASKTVSFYPTGPGSSSSWSRVNCVANWQCIDEQALSTLDYLTASSFWSSLTDFYATSLTLPPGSTVTSIKVFAVARETTSNPLYLYLGYENPSTGGQFFKPVNPTTSWAQYSAEWTSSLPTQTQFPIQIGIRSSPFYTFQVAQVWAQITYTTTSGSSSSGPITSGLVTTQDYTVDFEVKQELDLVNQYRAQNGRGALTASGTLTDIAKWMAVDMASKNYFSHTDSLGRDPFQRMNDLGYGYNTWRGENLAAGASSAVDIFNGWRNSPAHNDNLLRPEFTTIGMYRAYNPNSTYGWYWAQEFGGYVDVPVNYVAPQPTPTPAVSNGTIQGYKLNGYGPSGVNETVSLDGGAGNGDNPYFITATAATHTVSVSVPNGWTVGSTMCVNSTNCHTASNLVMGSSRSVTVPANGYVDLWWHYFPPPTLIVSKNPCLVVSGSTCMASVKWTAAPYSSATVCYSTGGGSETTISWGDSGTSSVTLPTGRWYNFILRSSSCGQGTVLQNLSVRFSTAGDVNCDNQIDAVDSLLIQRYVAALSVTGTQCAGGGFNKAAADVNGDGVIDAVDALLVLRYVSS